MTTFSGLNMEKITQAVILAGGQGKRLKPFTNNSPKPMIPVNGKPFLEHLIELLKNNNIKEAVILTGYLGDQIEKHFGNGRKSGIKIKYSYTPFLNEKGEENLSGLRLKNAEKLLDNFFLLLYCDNYWFLQLDKLIKFYEKHPSDILVTVYSNLDNSTKNNMLIDNKGYVIKYDKERLKKNLNCVDIGFFIVNKKILELLPKSNSQFEKTVLPKLIQKRRLSAYLTNHKYYSISDLQRVKIIEKFLAPKKVILLDRDGVINKRPPKADYVKKWEEFEFLPGAIEAIRILNSKGYKIFVLSNQPGIARGMITEKDLSIIHNNMQKELKKHGARIDGIYFCPHGWNEGCHCRKPKPGLLLQASKEHLIDLTKTILIGDDERDIEAGKSVGCKTFLVDERRNLLTIVHEIS